MANASKKKSASKTKKARSSSKKREIKKIEKKISSERDKDINKTLINNFIAIQKVMVNLSAKFDNLSSQISKLLELFEISAKSLAEKDFEKNREDKSSKEILNKLNNISQQAGLIGKGLVLIHEEGSGRGFAPKIENHEEKWKGMEPSKSMRPEHSMLLSKERIKKQDPNKITSANKFRSNVSSQNTFNTANRNKEPYISSLPQSPEQKNEQGPKAQEIEE